MAKEGIKEWIVSGAFQIDATEDDLLLREVNTNEWSRYAMFDFKRFSIAGWESYFASIRRSANQPTFGVSTVALYYSAFYFAHALLRIAGTAVIYLEKPTANKLTSIVRIFEPEFDAITKGEYKVLIEPKTNASADVHIRPISGSGGTHQVFWREFLSTITEIENSALAQQTPWSGPLNEACTAIRRALKSNNSQDGHWLSEFRNSVSYRHEYDVWQPTNKKSEVNKILSEYSRRPPESIRLDVDPKISPVTSFTNGCQLLVEIGIEVANHFATTGKTHNHFGGIWERVTKEYAIS